MVKVPDTEEEMLTVMEEVINRMEQRLMDMTRLHDEALERGVYPPDWKKEMAELNMHKQDLQRMKGITFSGSQS